MWLILGFYFGGCYLILVGFVVVIVAIGIRVRLGCSGGV